MPQNFVVSGRVEEEDSLSILHLPLSLLFFRSLPSTLVSPLPNRLLYTMMERLRHPQPRCCHVGTGLAFLGVEIGVSLSGKFHQIERRIAAFRSQISRAGRILRISCLDCFLGVLPKNPESSGIFHRLLSSSLS